MTSTAPPVLSIGSILGDSDSESRVWLQEIRILSRGAETLRKDVRSPLHVNVVYHVDGRLVSNEFQGVRTGRFDRRTPELMVQAAVSLTPSDDRRGVLVNLLREAVEEAERFARRKGLADELKELRGLIDRVSSDHVGA